MSFATIIAGLSEKGKEHAHTERHRMREAFIASRAAVKHGPWLPSDDKAFDAIDIIVGQLMAEAGMVAPPQPAQRYPTQSEMIDTLRNIGYTVEVANNEKSAPAPSTVRPTVGKPPSFA